MKNIFIDTNIIIDLLADRKPFSKFAIELVGRAEQRKLSLFVSSHSIATTHYLLKKFFDEKELRGILYDLCEILTVVPIDQSIVKKSLKSKHKDFEDALQISCAYSVGTIDCIVTRNIKDFRNSEIPVFSPEQIVSKI